MPIISSHSAIASAPFADGTPGPPPSGRDIFTWDGNYYAINLTERLQVEQKGGMLRIGLVHYNTLEEVERLVGAPDEFASQ